MTENKQFKVNTDWSIWSLAYCQVDMAQDFFGGAGIYSNTGTSMSPMIYTLLVGGEVGGKQHVVLVDCGFQNNHWLTRYAFSSWESPEDVLGRIGFTPEDVDTILVTHMHFDHMGNFEAFPNAKLYIQLDEYTGWNKAVCASHQHETEEEKEWVFTSFDPNDLIRAAQGVTDGRIKFITGDEEVLPGITARLAKDTHTFGSQWFEINTHNGPFIAAGDIVYWYSNIEKMWPPGYHQGNAFNQIETYRTMRGVVKNQFERVIPGHDSEIWNRHVTWKAPSGNQIAELNLRDGDTSRRPHISNEKKIYL
ncbi:N-acyl homoserine lactonase family protein [Shewanella sp. C32]|uniref:N-acyl homoserine lactonase family protein n=1 Tax=Shewanella electrica TaxID=515560 RepID=A0ABT2FJE6_9GAMM|nr:N-acyl homoserine lactonase family protein [Shewanella electrica]MCH1924209.1 N-acyl homoserine lactonase family protein [Shewanella electrica]MCS4556112.1 N-acyl homoserine lactonase family protein [Shewanella electrica]